MRRALLTSLGVPLVLLAVPGPAAADFGEPVSVTATAPPVVGLGSPFPLTVEVTANAGALDIAAPPLRLRVRLAPVCGGTFAGTEGTTAIERTLPAPSPGAAYSFKATGSAKLTELGPETVCAFLEDVQERQFATDTEEVIAVIPGCGLSSRQLTTVGKQLRRVERKLAKAKRLRRHASGKHRRALSRRIKHLRVRRHVLAKRKHRAAENVKQVCAQGEAI